VGRLGPPQPPRLWRPCNVCCWIVKLLLLLKCLSNTWTNRVTKVNFGLTRTACVHWCTILLHSKVLLLMNKYLPAYLFTHWLYSPTAAELGQIPCSTAAQIRRPTEWPRSTLDWQVYYMQCMLVDSKVAVDEQVCACKQISSLFHSLTVQPNSSREVNMQANRVTKVSSIIIHAGYHNVA